MAAAAPVGEEPGVAKLAEQGLAQVADFFSGGIPAPWGGASEGGADDGRGSWSFPDVGIPDVFSGGDGERRGSWGLPDVGLSSFLGQEPECPEGPGDAGGAACKEPAAQATSPTRGRGRGLAGPDGGLHKWHRKLAGAKGRMDGQTPKETDAQLSQTSQASSVSTASGATSPSGKKVSTASAASQRSSGSAGAPQIATFQPWKPAEKPVKKPSGGKAADPLPAAAPAAKKPAPQIATLQPWKPVEKPAAAPTPQPAADPQIATFQPWKPAAKAAESGIATADDEASPAMQVPSEPIVRIPEAAAQHAPGAPEPPECTSSEPPVCPTMSYPTLDDSMMFPASLPNPRVASTSPRRAALDTCPEEPAPAAAPAPAARSVVADADAQKPACLLGAGLVGHVVTTGTDLDLTRPGGLPPPSGPQSLDQTMPGGKPLHR